MQSPKYSSLGFVMVSSVYFKQPSMSWKVWDILDQYNQNTSEKQYEYYERETLYQTQRRKKLCSPEKL